jgi:hypothetical protein
MGYDMGYFSKYEPTSDRRQPKVTVMAGPAAELLRSNN